MRLFVFCALLFALGSTQRISNETYQDNTINLIYELRLRDATYLRGTIEEENDALVSAFWNSESASVITMTYGGSFAPVLYKLNYRDLASGSDSSPTPYVQQEYGTTDIAFDAGTYSPGEDALFMISSKTVYLFEDLVGGDFATAVQAPRKYEFPSSLTSLAAFYSDETAWFVQFANITDENSTYAIGVNSNQFNLAYPLGQYPVFIGENDILGADVAEEANTQFLGSRFGVVQVRSSLFPSLDLIASFTLTGADVRNFVWDVERDRLFMCATISSTVMLLRLDTSLGWDYWNGKVFNANTTGMKGFSSTQLLKVGLCNDIVIDSAIGTGYVAMVDSSSIGFLAKVNLRTMESVINYIPIEREDSPIVSLHLENVGGRTFLYGVTTYTIAIWEYTTACSLDCNIDSGNGECVDGFCECNDKWWGLACLAIACDPPCGDYEEPFRGECISGQCVCQPRWEGEGCTVERCPNDCQGNGDCDADANFTCICNDVRGGDDCSQLKYEWCDQLNHVENLTGSLKDACLALTPYLGCGYCGHYHDNATGINRELCLDGDRAGPVVDACLWWFYDGNWNPAFLVFIIVMMVSWGVMFLLNGYSMLAEDWRFANMRTENKSPHYYGTKGYQKTLWWRDERSHKSWKMFDQMQFLAAYGVINAMFTTKLYNFLAFWNWTLFVIPFSGPFQYEGYHPLRAFNWTPIDFPFPPIPPEVWTGQPVPAGGQKRGFVLEADYTYTDGQFFSSARTPVWTVTRQEEQISEKRDYEQFVNSSETMADLIFPTAVLWLLVTLTIFMLSYAIYYAVMIFIVRRDDNDEHKKILGYRFKHILARTLHAFYFPAIFLGVFAIQVEQKPVIILAIVFGLIFIGFGLPGFFVMLTQQPLLTEWFDPALRIPYGSFYAPFQKKRIKFQFFVYLRKFATAAALAAMARGFNEGDESLFWAQVIVTLAFFIIYLVLLFWKRPYIDMIHLCVDAALCLLNGVTVILALLAIQSDAGTQDAVQWIVLVIQIPTMFLVVVAYCWSSMFYAGYTSPKQFFCCEGKPVQEGDDKLIEAQGNEGGEPAEPEDKGPADFSSDEALNNMDLSSSTSVD